ncbi:N-acetylgalactosamine-N, N'-diacetylbacillosaminyl-diphospho-undecaprenol 4-alpha-N-acetylgalactosaminyltransferase [Paraburkholderia nemoris]|uniref:glycosyltransferase n=1 Tax=Paraburkholderia nemoris TaxID=2793076 RepID=UPI00190D7706|nr:MULTISPECIES: glycosyltransferase [Paraburkholderia]MBK3786697.1 glycosyltransferase family 4 protein [Paraburkholderia aspalathi]CAE6844981.1 N-acetylgalactosamine-N, N'-diacetylbacillosaminyl-diphospho-undecaprenol 4-alpha-N-acetylgalactosaminyltransferase [Paraburkholderia nemoris]
MNTVLDVLIHIPSLRGGGAERVAVEVARYMASRGLRVAIFVHDPKLDFALPPGVTLIVANSRRHLGRVFELRGLLARHRARSLISLLPYANLISLFAGISRGKRTRLIVSEHTSIAFRRPGVKGRVTRAITMLLYPFSDAIVAVSSGIAAELDARMPCIGRRNIVVIHNPCYVPAKALTASRQIAACPNILAVGRLAWEKGFDTLIRAFAQVHREVGGARLTILGEGRERTRLEALAESEGVADFVSLPGFSAQVFDAYRTADLFVCSSRVEGFGNVIVEALSFGLPIVSTRCMHGPAEILQNGRFGMLVAVDDVSAMARAIVDSLRRRCDPSRQVMRARDFSLDEIGAQYLRVAGFEQ